MKRISLSILLAIFVALGLTGCVGKVSQPINNTGMVKDKTFKFKEQDSFGNEVSEKEVEKAILESMLNASSYKRDFISSRGDGYYLSKNRKGTIEGNTLALTYNHLFHHSTEKIETTTTKFTYPFAIGSQDGYTIATLAAPSNMDHIPEGLIENDPFDDLEDLEADAVKIYKSANPKIKKRYTAAGSINSKYDDASIFGNFKRLLKPWKNNDKSITKDMIGKGSVFQMPYNDTVYPVVVDVFPYRGGSKVDYKLIIDYYFLPNGATTASTDDVAKMEEKIKQIVND